MLKETHTNANLSGLLRDAERMFSPETNPHITEMKSAKLKKPGEWGIYVFYKSTWPISHSMVGQIMMLCASYDIGFLIKACHKNEYMIVLKNDESWLG